MTINTDILPTEILESSRAVVWNWEIRDGRLTKVPYQAHRPSSKARVDDPATWASFAEAIGAVEDGKADGAGIVLGDGQGGIDLDDCRDPATGLLAPWARQVVDMFPSYTEISPSGTGVKIFIRLDPTLTLRGINHRRPKGSTGKGAAIELYCTGKYFTVTGQHVEGTPTTLEEQTAPFVALHDRLSGGNGRTDTHGPRATSGDPVPVAAGDAALLNKARAARNGAKFSRLWGGDISDYPSNSEADFALCSLLAFWTGPDAGRIDGLFRQSGLMRGKWDERHGSHTYGEMTVEKAVAGCRDTYTGAARRVALATIAQRAAGVQLEDFHSYMPMHTYIFAPTCEMWPAASVNARLPSVTLTGGEGDPLLDPVTNTPRTMKPAVWLDRHRAVEQMTWAPGQPRLIRGRLVSEGGWMRRNGVTTFNLYRPPEIEDGGDPAAVGRWRDHVRRLYGDHADHIERWCAHRVQRPHEKVNHALVLGGSQGIGKDTLLEPLKHAVGPWNFLEICPSHLLGRFNGFVKSVVLRISEARDLGDVNRYAFYEHLKVYTAAPPDVLRVDEKNLREYAVWNICGVVVTTNHKIGGLYLPADDRRHYVAWTDLTKDDFPSTYWTQLYAWYDGGGKDHVAAYLRTLDLSTFDPKAPPPKTQAFWDLVDADRTPEDAEVADALDRLNRPMVVTIADLARLSDASLGEWLRDRKNARQVPHRLERAGYVAVRNTAAKDGLWKLGGHRQVIYGRIDLADRDRYLAAQELGGGR
ncbi:MAG: DUF5906 domain-containing protein [Acidobacteriota bacterium]